LKGALLDADKMLETTTKVEKCGWHDEIK